MVTNDQNVLHVSPWAAEDLAVTNDQYLVHVVTMSC